MKKAGTPYKPKEEKFIESVTIQLKRRTKEELGRIAAKQKTTVSFLIRDLIETYLMLPRNKEE